MVIDYLDNYKTENVLKISGKVHPTVLNFLQPCPLYFGYSKMPLTLFS
jgi:hypothetical protein